MRRRDASGSSRALLLLAALLVLGALPAAGGCAQPAGTGKDQELVVFAASSLREVFEGLARHFESERPGTRVRLNLGGSQELRTQIEQGAEADIFASADARHVSALEERGLVETPIVFARNEPVLVVPRDNPAKIQSLVDLPRTRRLVVGAPEVPIGACAIRLLDGAARRYGADFRAQVEGAIISRELNVRQVLAKVSLGEADAGIVYVTDARAAAGKVQVIPLPEELKVLAEYPIAAVKSSRRPALGRAWVELVLSPEGQRRLAAAGFRTQAP